ncbi:MAG: exosortase system-associated protein, TIGR04073 family [Methylovulum sp.]|nr:exosortase system-associated protein, TIGR04073 family [Methylovulum sp.]
MKQLFTTTSLKTVLIVSALFFSTAYDASASSYPARLGAKLGNSIANAATGIVEIPKTIMVANREHGPAYAATAGLVTGMVHMIGRTLSGAYDLVTFMVPTKPIVTPDYVWEDFDKETSYRSTWQLR